MRRGTDGQRQQKRMTARIARATWGAITMATCAAPALAVTDAVCYWGNNYSGVWSDTNPANTTGKVAGWWDQTGDGIADVPDDVDPADGTNVIARFAPMTGSTVTLDSSRTVSRVWYNWNGTSGATASGSFTLGISGGSVLTLARDGGTPEIHIGYRYTSGNSGIGMTVNAPLAGTQGFTVGCPATDSYGGFGLVLGGANTVSGTISGFRLLTLRNELAAQNARVSIASAFKLRLRHDTDNATFRTAGVVVNSTSTSAGATIDVDRVSASGDTDHVLVLDGPLTVSGQDRHKTLSVTGSNGYRLELAGCYTNTFAASASRINADSANVVLSGAAHDLGGGLVLGGAMATGINAITGVLEGSGGLVKTNAAVWALSGTNTYAGTTQVNEGVLLVDGGSIGTEALTSDDVTVNAGGSLGGDGGTVLADVAVGSGGSLSPGSADDTGSLVGTLAAGSATQPVAVVFSDGAVLAADVDGADADLLSVVGTVGLGASPEDAVTIAVRELDTPVSGAYKVIGATGGINVVGSLTFAEGSSFARTELRSGGTELWILPPPPLCSLITVR